MTTKATIILVTSGLAVAGITFYFLYWRTKDAVSQKDMQILQQYRPVLQGSAAAAATTPSAPSIADQTFGGLIPIIPVFQI